MITDEMERVRSAIRKHPRRTITLGFASVIFVGACLLATPLAVEPGKSVGFINSLFTSTSAVCVTGLVTVDTADSFTVFGETVVAVLIQIGGLGITSIGVIAILIASGQISVGARKLAKEAFNLSSEKGLRDVIKAVLYVTFTTEAIGAIFSFITFATKFKLLDAVGISVFHSIASFNNAGFDIFGGFKSMADFKGDIWINLVTAILIIMGGIGFFVTMEVASKKRFRRYSLHTKVVLCTTLFLIVAGTLGIKLSQGETWLSAGFHSVSARTAGFATEDMGNFSTATLLIIMALMFVGASPGSTGGGIKTTTLFVIWKELISVAFNRHRSAFKRTIPENVAGKAMVVVFLAILCIFVSTTLIVIFEPNIALDRILFEVVSAFATVGLSTGITPHLTDASKLVLIFTMFIGRVGPLTLLTLWSGQTLPRARYSEEQITIG